MLLDELKKEVCKANKELYKKGIVIYTWGNASAITEDRKYVVIKPSGISYEKMSFEDMVVIEMSTGKVIGKGLNPSSDTPTHLELYRSFPEIKGIAHTHSINAVSFAQAGMGIPALGTTHADYFYGDIKCTRSLTEAEVKTNYELNTGRVIVETINQLSIDVNAVPGILVRNHGPFSWGKSVDEAVYNAVVLETVAEMAIKTISLNSDSKIPWYIMDKHYNRKHGENAYYGQIKR